MKAVIQVALLGAVSLLAVRCSSAVSAPKPDSDQKAKDVAYVQSWIKALPGYEEDSNGRFEGPEIAQVRADLESIDEQSPDFHAQVVNLGKDVQVLNGLDDFLDGHYIL